MLLADRRFDHESREAYFANPTLIGDFDLFLDPDTGIEPRNGCDEKHVRLTDVDRILPLNGHRLVLIYQHSQPYNMRDSVLNRLPILSRTLADLWPLGWRGFDAVHFKVPKSNRRSSGLLNELVRAVRDR